MNSFYKNECNFIFIMKIQTVGCPALRTMNCLGACVDASVELIGSVDDAVSVEVIGSTGMFDDGSVIASVVVEVLVDDDAVAITSAVGVRLFRFQWSRNVLSGIPKSRAAARMELPISIAQSARTITSADRFSVLRTYFRTIVTTLLL